MRVSPVNLKILACTLDVEGHDASQVLARCGIPSLDALADDGEWLPLAVFDRMMDATLDATGDEAFGLVAGKSIALMRYGAITPLVLATPSLRQMIEDIRRFAVLSVAHAEVDLVESPHAARLVVQPLVHAGRSGRFRTEQVATSAMQMLRFAGAGPHDIHHVDFPYALAERQQRRYEATFGPRLRFLRRECAIGFRAGLLDARMPSHDPVAYLAARSRAETLLAAMRARSDAADQVRRHVLGALPQRPSVAETAASLGQQERSLRRELAALGTSHEALLQECQQRVAEALLARGELPLKRIAELTGFGSVHSFHRAFRRWSGVTPTAWREGGGVPADRRMD